MIISEWEYQDGEIKYHIEIPANMKAEILLNGAEKLNVSAGIYKFTVKNAQI